MPAAAARLLVLLLAAVAGGLGERQVLHREGAAPTAGVGRRATMLAAAAAAIGVVADDQGAFDSLDRDNSKTIDREEYMMKVWQSLIASDDTVGERNNGFVLDFYERLFTAADIDEDGELMEAEWEYSRFLANEGLKNENFHSDDEFQVKSSQKLFREMDLNDDERVDQDEFLSVLRESAAKRGWGEVLDSEVKAWMDSIFEKADVGGNGHLDRKRLQYAAYLINCDLLVGRFADRTLAGMMFDELDYNGDGLIDASEVADGVLRDAQAHELRGENASNNIMAQIGKLFNEADVDSDGSLNREEANNLAQHILYSGGEL
mmetsp:Transcript_121991/g.352422  ORF Transcript_121991/g.352422 Transcript_121991/m.352422 type:complete len:319 (+) Transcript_121991:49-1005(+)